MSTLDELRHRVRAALCALVIAFCALAAHGQTFVGTVREADGGPLLKSMVVAVYGTDGVLRGNTTTNTNGDYSVTVPAGQYHVLAYDPTGAHATEFANDAPSYEESPVSTVGAGDTVRIDFVLQKGISVAGNASTSGGLRPGLTVAAYNLSGTRRGFALTNSQGNYSIVLPPGTYKFVAYDDAGAFAPAFFRDEQTFDDADTVKLEAGKPAPRVDFSLQLAARFLGIVTDSNGTPLNDVAVLAYNSAGKFIASMTTGSDGRFAMSLQPGTYRFVAVDPNFVYAAGFLSNANSFALSPAITLNAGQSKSDLVFRLERGGLVKGRIVDATTGNGVPGLTVAAYNPDGTMRTFVITDANGAYTLLLPTGAFRIAVFDVSLVYATSFYPGQTLFARAATISANVGQTMTLPDLAVTHGGKVSGTITDTVTHVPVAGALVVAYDTNGFNVGQTTAGTDGTFRMVLPAGSFRLVASDPALRYAAGYSGPSANFDQSTAVTVAVDAQIINDFALARGTLVTGSVVNQDHLSIAGAQVAALDLSGHRMATATTDANGTFQLPLVPASYKFIVTDPSGRNAASYYGGATFDTATAVKVDATGAPRFTVILQPLSKRRSVHH